MVIHTLECPIFLLVSIILSRMRCASHVCFYSFPKIFPKTIAPFYLRPFPEISFGPKPLSFCRDYILRPTLLLGISAIFFKIICIV